MKREQSCPFPSLRTNSDSAETTFREAVPVNRIMKYTIIGLILVSHQIPLLQVTREVAKRTDDLTHQVHRETLSRSIEQVKTLAPILICSMKIFIQIIQQGKQYGSLSKSRRGSREKTKSGQRFYPRSRRDEAGAGGRQAGGGKNKG